MDYKIATQYYCPMKCEGEKVYEKPGDCPVCNMHLIPVNGQETEEEHDPGLKHKHSRHQDSHKDHDPQGRNGRESRIEGKGKYYCPMRCEGDKVYDEPGDCPVCGMHLKKEETPAGSEQSSEEEKAYKDMAGKFWIALALSIPLFIIAMAGMFEFLHLSGLL